MRKSTKPKSRGVSSRDGASKYAYEETFRATIETENSEHMQQPTKPRTQYSQRRWKKVDRIRTETATFQKSGIIEPLTNKAIKSKLLGYRDQSLIQQLFQAGVSSPTDINQDQRQQERAKLRRCSYNKRIPLLFLRPYSKYSSSATKTLEDVKSQLYSSVKRGDIYYSKQQQPIEYFTEYGDKQFDLKPKQKQNILTLTPKRSPKMSAACNIFKHQIESSKQKRSQSSNVNDKKKLGAFYVNNFLNLL